MIVLSDELKSFTHRSFDGGVLFNADCLDVLNHMDKNSVEVAVTSPPYNLCKRYSNYKNSKTSASMTEKYDKWYFDEMPEWEYQGNQQAVIHRMLKVCRSSVFYNHKVRFAWHNRNIFRTESNLHHPMDWLNKFPIWCEIIWDRCGIGNPSRRYHIQEERIYQIGKPVKWDNSLGLTNIWKIPPSRNTGHVCTFPEKLVENSILPTTELTDTVLDPYVGIEKDPAYFEQACENVQKAIEAQARGAR